ncbi:hypothetical protein PYCCODRAFT_962917 [Trametes coccinea BRFM310]|uniref:Uncharacterized protein n=1 Tax=Trametes coccinea (strain BRFM310) TaxID=1353009 RepID=A0A1Y2IDC4_TRAC3|nr:hypothetical protein PYCCODRAFT_962917 [Trametes coccinea BRFM310]
MDGLLRGILVVVVVVVSTSSSLRPLGLQPVTVWAYATVFSNAIHDLATHLFPPPSPTSSSNSRNHYASLLLDRLLPPIPQSRIIPSPSPPICPSATSHP